MQSDYFILVLFSSCLYFPLPSCLQVFSSVFRFMFLSHLFQVFNKSCSLVTGYELENRVSIPAEGITLNIHNGS